MSLPDPDHGSRRGLVWVLAGLSIWLAASALRAQPQTANSRSHERRAGASDSHGRTADQPSEIPVRGWRDILIRTYRSISEDRVMVLAAGMTYYVLLALFPGITALVSIYGLIADPAVIEQQLSTLSSIMPKEAIGIIGGQLHYLASQDSRTLGLAFIAGLLVSLWSANAAISALFDALNVVYGEREKRNYFKRTALALCFTAGLVLFLAVALAGIVAVPAVLHFVLLGGAGEWIIPVLRWPALLVLLVLGLAILYRFGPSRADAQWRWLTWGSVAAAVLWIVASILFSWYAANFASYNKTYGSLGAIIAFMVWTWLSMTIVLLGGELNAEIEHQTARDSTTGAPRPLGMRGARMADTVGARQD
ncbi:MAG TPA: YihY/virulence factor BrkB family protein [Dongiaceae bacterium]|nr:YihY/virulence factor BrkB family protein [Dongiaceae bacterium]